MTRDRNFVTVSSVEFTALCHAIERAALREHAIPRDDMVARLDVILEEFANILAAYVDYKRRVNEAEVAKLDEEMFPGGVLMQ